FDVDADLAEWEYGELEGLTMPEIQARYPGWSIWEGPWPGGESAMDVAARADRVVQRVVASGLERVAAVGHGHFSRVLAARWVGAEVPVASWLDLDTATRSELGWSRGTPVLRHWNVEPPRP
ncbi:MAG TPA: histidine phosphatase family protein, partial [Acidimicrobiales bacterium]